MGKRRPSGDGMVRMREDGRWEGRIVVGHKANGDSIFLYFSAGSQRELMLKLHREQEVYQGVDLTEETPEELGVLEELMRLPGKYREVIHLHYIEGYRIAEIAEMLGRKESTVKVQLHRGRELLRLNLEERGIQP